MVMLMMVVMMVVMMMVMVVVVVMMVIMIVMMVIMIVMMVLVTPDGFFLQGKSKDMRGRAKGRNNKIICSRLLAMIYLQREFLQRYARTCSAMLSIATGRGGANSGFPTHFHVRWGPRSSDLYI